VEIGPGGFLVWMFDFSSIRGHLLSVIEDTQVAAFLPFFPP